MAGLEPASFFCYNQGMYQTKNYYSNAKKTEYNGYLYDSKLEASYAADLDLLIKAGEIKSFDRQVNLDLEVNGYVVCQYRIDFIIHHNDDTLEYVETKGVATDVWKLKWKLFEALFCDKPDVKLTVVYQGKNWRPRLHKKKIR